MEAFGKLKGFTDLYGPELAPFTHMERSARVIFPRYGYEEIRPPIVEFTGLFQRGIGEETDVVQKEMFTFPDRKGRSLTLRPEATAGVLRAAISLGLARAGHVARLFTTGPMFRYERPQKGRQRQFHQLNCECLGSDSPYADAELIAMLLQFLGDIGLRNLVLKLNSLGCKECRPVYITALSEYLASLPKEDFCADCQRRMHTNPLRVLDCKQDQEKLLEAPHFLDMICGECAEHFQQVLGLLADAGIAYEIDDRLVRGLDYYARTTFEVVSGQIGAQAAVAGGGRYDGLVSQLGGDDVPGVGFACGMERLALLMSAPDAAPMDFYIFGLDAAARKEAFLLAENLRRQNLAGEMAFGDGSMKSLMRQASGSGARYCLIIGSDELVNGTVAVKNMRDGSQSHVSRKDVAAALKQM